MKTYEKPVLNALSLSGNSLLCSCAYDVVEPSNDQDLIDTLRDLYGDISKLFSQQDGSCEEPINFKGYCKNTPSADLKVFNS